MISPLRFICVSLAVILGVATGPFAHGQTPQPADAPKNTYAPVVVEGRRLLEVTGDAKFSAAERADRINRRLRSLIVRDSDVAPFSPEDVVTRAGETLVTIGGEPVLAVTVGDAQDNLSTPDELATRWGETLAEAVRDARAVRQNPLSGVGILVRNSAGDLALSIIGWLPRLVGALFLIGIFWYLARGVSRLVFFASERASLDANLTQLLRTIAHNGVSVLGGLAILTTLGFHAEALVTALGVSGFVLGFAFKDILSHFLAGLMLLWGKTFRIGDQIVFKEHEGTVERIELRALFLRTYDNRLVIIPNAEVFTSVVTSNTASPHRRRDFIVAIDYDQDVDRARQVVLEAVKGTPGVLEDPEPDVLVDELAAYAVNLRVRFYSNSLRIEFLRVGSACMQRVKEALARNGISIPGPRQTVVVKRAPDDRPQENGRSSRTDDVSLEEATSPANAVT